MPLPKGRGSRKLPRPFQRKSIDISHHGRTWREVPVESVKRDDIVVGVGVLQQDAVVYENEPPQRGFVELKGPELTVSFDLDSKVRAFVRAVQA